MTEEEFLAGAYDVNRPKENPDTFLPIRESLIRICRVYRLLFGTGVFKRTTDS